MAQFSVTGLLRRLGEALFRRDDELARQQGWEIETGRLGLSRTYMHPGFRRLARCPDCQGRGERMGSSCETCAGTGRVTLPQPSIRGRRVTR